MPAADPIHILPSNVNLSPPNSPSSTRTDVDVNVHQTARERDVLTPPQTPHATYAWDNKLFLAYSDEDDDYPYVVEHRPPTIGLGIDLNGGFPAVRDEARGRRDLYLGYQPDDLIPPRVSPRGCRGHLVLDLTTLSHGRAVGSTFHTIAHPRFSWQQLMAEVERVVEGPPVAGKVSTDNSRKPRAIWVGLRTGQLRTGHGEGEGLDGLQWEMVWRDVEVVKVRVEVGSLEEERGLELEEFGDMEW
ncbi:hypothetical protein SAICODRAFT_29395 [Saitoella complicata NRRL Y-17804]|nr:uncharacterized protein SAICODRAFT_29395 [Saitoella complicata NRRL Y-17804]ODQ54717.1 hypothetical protein SAICODRAFT_29395 [Saitoella complicata NRRL Y-17804]